MSKFLLMFDDLMSQRKSTFNHIKTYPKCILHLLRSTPRKSGVTSQTAVNPWRQRATLHARPITTPSVALQMIRSPQQPGTCISETQLLPKLRRFPRNVHSLLKAADLEKLKYTMTSDIKIIEPLDRRTEHQRP